MPYADIKTLIEKELNGDSLTLDEWERYNQWTFVEFPENLQKEFSALVLKVERKGNITKLYKRRIQPDRNLKLEFLTAPSNRRLNAQTMCSL